MAPLKEQPCQVVIAGAGIVGLVLALALEKHVGVIAECYDQASKFEDDYGAGLGMYPNGLRVLRDLSPELLKTIRAEGYPYLFRRWERHDGTEVATAEESVLCDGEDELQSVGIRRWRLQKALFEAVQKKGIPVYFKKRVHNVSTRVNGNVVLEFEDGTQRETQILFGVDGSKSKIRDIMVTKKEDSELKYTGVTCLMGISDVGRPCRGICFPSSSTTKCHAVFFPTGEKEQCFQFHFPIDEPKRHSWGALSDEEAAAECGELAERLRQDGWHEKYLAPLTNVSHAVRVGFCLMEPRLQKLAYGAKKNIVLLGDAAHPPVPYTGQGSQMGMEDAGVISLLLKNLCLDDNGAFHIANFDVAMQIYERIRMPRTAEINDKSIYMGMMQQKRADNAKYNVVKEELIKRDVFFHETIPVYLPGTKYDFKMAVAKALAEEPTLLPVIQENE